MTKRKRNCFVITGALAVITCLCGAIAVLVAPTLPASNRSQPITPTAETIVVETNSPTPPPTATESPTDSPAATIEPTSTPISSTPTWTPPAKGFDIIAIPATITVGGFAYIEIHTMPGSTCIITFKLPSGRISSDDSLRNRTAGENGMCSWNWEVAGNIKPGRGSFTIQANGASETRSVTLVK